MMNQQHRKSSNMSQQNGVTSSANHRQRMQQLQSPVRGTPNSSSNNQHYQHTVIQQASQQSYGVMSGSASAHSAAAHGGGFSSGVGSAGHPAPPKYFPIVKPQQQQSTKNMAVRQDDSVQQRPNRTTTQFKQNTLQTSTNYQRHSAAIMPLKQAAQQSSINFGGGFSNNSGGHSNMSSSTNNLPTPTMSSSFGGAAQHLKQLMQPRGAAGGGFYHHANQHQHPHHQATSAPSIKSSVSTQHAIIASAIQDHHHHRDIKAAAVNSTDLHDCTNEEQMEDEFEMIDRDEIFDECDEQTGIQRHQMNVGLSRHPKAITSDMFNVFNRQQQLSASNNNPHQSQEIPQQQQTQGMNSLQQSVGRLSSNSKPLINTSTGTNNNSKAARDRQNYNDFLRSSSPQLNAISRDGSRSPPALAHFQKEAFFGSSFAGNAGILGSGGRPSVEKNTNSSSQLPPQPQIQFSASSQGATGKMMNPTSSFGGVIRNNTFALSSVNKFRPQPSGSAATNSQGESQSPIRIPQDKGPQNFKNLDIGLPQQIPDQFRADLLRIEQQQHLNDHLQSKEEEHAETVGVVDVDATDGINDTINSMNQPQETEDVHTYDAPHVLPTTMQHNHNNAVNSGVHPMMHLIRGGQNVGGIVSGNNRDVFETDQDTIIDQDDDVAEECSIADQQQNSQQQQSQDQNCLQLQTQSTQHHDGPVYRFMMGRRNQEEDIQDETAIEDEDLHAAGFSNRQLAVPTKISQQQITGQPSLMSFAPTSNSCFQAPQQDSAAGATANFHTSSNQNILLASQSSSVTTLTSNMLHKSGPSNRHPLANKPRTNMIGGLPPNLTSTASKPRMLLQSSGQINSIGTTRSLSRVSKTSGQPNPSINEKRLYHNNTHASILSNERPNPNMQGSKGAVCETVEDIQESVAFMSNNTLVQTDSQKRHYPVTANTSQTKSHNDIDIKRMDFQQASANDTPDMRAKVQSSNKTDQRLGASGMQQFLVSGSQGRPTLSKKDNKDSKKEPGDITISELQSSTQQHSNIHLENQEMHFSKAAGVDGTPMSNLSASQQVMTRTGGLQPDFRQGTFRSPHASPGGKLQMHSSNASHSHSNKAGTSTVKAAETSMKKALIANQHFFQRQKSNKTEVPVAGGSVVIQDDQNSKQGQKNQPYFAEDTQSQGHNESMNNAALLQQTSNSVQDTSGVYGTRRDTANFYTAQEHHSASLPKQQNMAVSKQLPQQPPQPLTQSDTATSNQKSHAELANEYLELQRTLAQVQQAQQLTVSQPVIGLNKAADGQSSAIPGGSQQLKEIDDDTSVVSQISKNKSSNHMRDSSDFAAAGNRKKQPGAAAGGSIHRPQRNNTGVASARLTPKSSYGGAAGPKGSKGPQDGSSETNNDDSSAYLKSGGAGSGKQGGIRRQSKDPSINGGRQGSDSSQVISQARMQGAHQQRRPYQPHNNQSHKRNMTNDEDSVAKNIQNAGSASSKVLGSPAQNHQKVVALSTKNNQQAIAMGGRATGRKSPAPYIKSASGVGDKRQRNARTFVEEDAVNKDTRQQIISQKQQPKQQYGHHNRSIMSNGAADNQPQSSAISSLLPMSQSMKGNNTHDDLASHSGVIIPSSGTAGMILAGGKKPRGQAQLKALAELRQRENRTVQTGQMITARQRSRGEGYLETPHHHQHRHHLNQRNHKSGGGVGAKSTHGTDRCDEETITTQGGGAGGGTTSENLHQVMRMRQDSSSVSPHDTYLRLTGNKQADHYYQNSASNDHTNSTRNYSKGTFERQMMMGDSIEEQSQSNLNQRPGDSTSLRMPRTMIQQKQQQQRTSASKKAAPESLLDDNNEQIEVRATNDPELDDISNQDGEDSKNNFLSRSQSAASNDSNELPSDEGGEYIHQEDEIANPSQNRQNQHSSKQYRNQSRRGLGAKKQQQVVEDDPFYGGDVEDDQDHDHQSHYNTSDDEGYNEDQQSYDDEEVQRQRAAGGNQAIYDEDGILADDMQQNQQDCGDETKVDRRIHKKLERRKRKDRTARKQQIFGDNSVEHQQDATGEYATHLEDDYNHFVDDAGDGNDIDTGHHSYYDEEEDRDEYYYEQANEYGDEYGDEGRSSQDQQQLIYDDEDDRHDADGYSSQNRSHQEGDQYVEDYDQEDEEGYAGTDSHSYYNNNMRNRAGRRGARGGSSHNKDAVSMRQQQLHHQQSKYRRGQQRQQYPGTTQYSSRATHQPVSSNNQRRGMKGNRGQSHYRQMQQYPQSNQSQQKRRILRHNNYSASQSYYDSDFNDEENNMIDNGEEGDTDYYDEQQQEQIEESSIEYHQQHYQAANNRRQQRNINNNNAIMPSQSRQSQQVASGADPQRRISGGPAGSRQRQNAANRNNKDNHRYQNNRQKQYKKQNTGTSTRMTNKQQQRNNAQQQPLKININMTGAGGNNPTNANPQQQQTQQPSQQTIPHPLAGLTPQQTNMFNPATAGAGAQPPVGQGPAPFMFYPPQSTPEQQHQQLLLMQQQQQQQFGGHPGAAALNLASAAGYQLHHHHLATAQTPGANAMLSSPNQQQQQNIQNNVLAAGATGVINNDQQQQQHQMVMASLNQNNPITSSNTTALSQRDSIQLRTAASAQVSAANTPNQQQTSKMVPAANPSQTASAQGIGWLSVAGGSNENNKTEGQMGSITVRKMSSNVQLPSLMGQQHQNQDAAATANDKDHAALSQAQVEDDDESNMDELWNRLRAHDKKQNSALTAPAVQVKKPVDPSPNLNSNEDDDSYQQEADLIGSKPSGRWASIDRSQTQEFTLSAPVVASHPQNSSNGGTFVVVDDNQQKSQRLQRPSATFEDQVAFEKEEENNLSNDAGKKQKKAEAIIIGFDDKPFANRPVLRSQRAVDPTAIATGPKQPQNNKVSAGGRVQSKVNNFSGGAGSGGKSFQAANGKARGGVDNFNASVKQQRGKDVLIVASGKSRQLNEQDLDGEMEVGPLGADFKKVTIEQIQAHEERLKRIKDQNLIQIFDDDEQDPSKAVHSHSTNQAPSIAEAFAAKRRAKLLQDRQNENGTPHNHQLDQDLAVAGDASCAPADGFSKPPIASKPHRVAKTPQELAQIRKAMMRKRHNTVESCNTPQTVGQQSGVSSTGIARKSSQNNVINISASVRQQNNKTPSVKEPNAALMERLAGGKRTQIDKKEMKKLTRINYENLPEIKRRKDEERKKQEALEKKERIAKYNKECKARQRTQLRKKREQQAAESQKQMVVMERDMAAAHQQQEGTVVEEVIDHEEQKISSVPLSAITLTVVTHKNVVPLPKKPQSQPQQFQQM